MICDISPWGILACSTASNDEIVTRYAPDGERLSTLRPQDLMTDEELQQKADDFGHRFSDFGVQGLFVSFQAAGTKRVVRVLRPLGASPDEPVLKCQIAALLQKPSIDVEALLRDLDNDLETRGRAARVLKEQGVHELPALEAALKRASGEKKAALEDVLASLRRLAPLRGLEKELK